MNDGNDGKAAENPPAEAGAEPPVDGGDEPPPDGGVRQAATEDAAAETPAPPPPASRELKRAAADVRILYSYLARQGKIVAPDLREAPGSDYAAIPDRILDGDAPPSFEDRAKLWRMLSELSALAHPATAESIRNSYYCQFIGATDSDESYSRSHKRSMRTIWHLGIVGFLLTLFLGLYVSFTSNVIDDTVKRIDEYIDVRTGNHTGTRFERAAKFLDARNSGLPPLPADPRAAPPQPPADDEAPQPPADGESPPPPEAENIAILQENLRQIAQEEIAREIIWSFRILSVTTLGLGQNMVRAEEAGQPPAGGDGPTDPGAGYSVFERMPLNAQRYINRTISMFILPALASLLGAVVFLLRDTELRMESVSLSPMRSDTYWPRIITAVIAGTMIGWLLTPDDALARISPAAAAFVLGYCTEILFRILDTFKQALGVTDEPARGSGRPGD